MRTSGPSSAADVPDDLTLTHPTAAAGFFGETRQVLCVTHLPQVASLAAHHLRISKVTDGKATRTQVDPLDNNERIDELARMLGGVKITKKTRDHAAEMLSARTRKKRAG